jgi:hypothetical protein
MLAAHNISAFGESNARTDTLEKFGVVSGLGLIVVRFIERLGFYMTELDGSPVRIELGSTVEQGKIAIRRLSPKLVSAQDLAADSSLDGIDDAIDITQDAYRDEPELTASQQKKVATALASTLLALGHISQTCEFVESLEAN